MDRLAEQAAAAIALLPDHETYGRVTKVLGLLVEIVGFGTDLSIGSLVHLRPGEDDDIPCEVVGFRDGHALLLPFGSLEGVSLGCRAVIQNTKPVLTPDERWLGRVVNGMAQPIDGKGPLPQGGIPSRCAMLHRRRIRGSAWESSLIWAYGRSTRFWRPAGVNGWGFSLARVWGSPSCCR